MQANVHKTSLRLLRASFSDRPAFGTAVSEAILTRVAAGELEASLRIHRPARELAFSKQDRAAAGFATAVAAAREAGFEPVVRLAGGRAAAFHEGTLAIAWATPADRPVAGTRERFESLATLVARALARLGVDARVGEVPREYCPGAWSVNARGRVKLAGIGQRLIAGGAHAGGVIVVADSALLRRALEPVYAALELDWDPATAGARRGRGPRGRPRSRSRRRSSPSWPRSSSSSRPRSTSRPWPWPSGWRAATWHDPAVTMRILAFSDLHRDLGGAATLVERSAEADVVIGAGDFASIHEGLAETIEALAPIEVPTVLVPGNNETEQALREATESWAAATVLHGEGAEIEGLHFFGLGAGVPVTPWDWSFDLTEQDAERELAGCPEGAVLVVHSPPYGHVDRSGGGDHLGSRAIRDAIESKRPRLAVCGHIHESWGRESELGPTRIANLGPSGAWFELSP